jgi:hypothetical protein
MTDVAMAGTFRLADVFRKSFAIYGRHFMPFVILTIIASIPKYVLLFMLGIPDGGAVASFVYTVCVWVALLVTEALASGAVTYGAVQELRGRTFSLAVSIQILVLRFLPMLGLAICIAIAISVGAMLLVVPGLIVACVCYVAMPACVAERTGFSESISRSISLTEGHRWQVLGAVLLMQFVNYVITRIIVSVLAPVGLTEMLIAMMAAATILNAFNGVLVSVFYYELRGTRKGIDSIDSKKIAGVFD